MNVFASRRAQNSTTTLLFLEFRQIASRANTSYKHRSSLIVDLNKVASEESATKLFVVVKFLQQMNRSEPLDWIIIIM